MRHFAEFIALVVPLDQLDRQCARAAHRRVCGTPQNPLALVDVAGLLCATAPKTSDFAAIRPFEFRKESSGLGLDGS